jgi:hypothetical protein
MHYVEDRIKKNRDYLRITFQEFDRRVKNSLDALVAMQRCFDHENHSLAKKKRIPSHQVEPTRSYRRIAKYFIIKTLISALLIATLPQLAEKMLAGSALLKSLPIT